MPDDNFCISTDYVARNEALTHDSLSGVAYWTPSRVSVSRSYQWGVYALAERELRRRFATSLVDVGCGPAPKLARLHARNPGVQVTGIDQASAVAYCRNRYPWGRWIAEDLAEPAHTAEDVKGQIVVCADVIEHVVNPDVLLEYVKRRVEPGGLLVISTPDRDRLRGPNCKSSPNPQHVREWTSEEFRRYLSSRGLRVTCQLHQLPVRLYPGLPLLTEIVLRGVRRQAIRYNQVCLAEVV